MDRRWDFFISYTQVDRAWAEWIAWALEEDSHRVLIQAWDFVPGSYWLAQMQAVMQGAARTIAVLSDAYLGSVYGGAEWQAAMASDPDGTGRKLLVVRVAACERPGLLSGVVGVDLFGISRAEARERLQVMVKGAASGRAKPEVEPPFPGTERAVPSEPGFPGRSHSRDLGRAHCEAEEIGLATSGGLEDREEIAGQGQHGRMILDEPRLTESRAPEAPAARRRLEAREKKMIGAGGLIVAVLSGIVTFAELYVNADMAIIAPLVAILSVALAALIAVNRGVRRIARKPFLVVIGLSVTVLPGAAIGGFIGYQFRPAVHGFSSARNLPSPVTHGVAPPVNPMMLPGPDNDAVAAVTFIQGGHFLAVAYDKGYIYLWNVANGKLDGKPLLDPGGGGVAGLAVNPGGGILAAADDNGQTYMWDVVTRQLIATLPNPGNDPVNNIAFSSNGDTLA